MMMIAMMMIVMMMLLIVMGYDDTDGGGNDDCDDVVDDDDDWHCDADDGVNIDDGDDDGLIHMMMMMMDRYINDMIWHASAYCCSTVYVLHGIVRISINRSCHPELCILIDHLSWMIMIYDRYRYGWSWCMIAMDDHDSTVMIRWWSWLIAMDDHCWMRYISTGCRYVNKLK